jgi:hypothetical protein
MTESAMTTHTVEHTPDDPPPRVTLLPLLSGGLAVVLVVAVSLSLWQRADQGRETPVGEGPAATVIAEALAESTAPRIGGMAELDRAQAAAAATAATASPIYLVASQAQADVAQRGLDEVDAFRAAQSDAPRTAAIVRLPSAAAETAFWLALQEQETIRAGLGLNPATVVDLRTPAARVPEPEPPAGSDQALDQRAPPAPTRLRTDTSDTLDGALAALPGTGPVEHRFGPVLAD